MRFESPLALLLLLVVGVAVALRYRLRQRSTLNFPTTIHLHDLPGSLRQQCAALPQILRVLTLVLLLFALARPQEGMEQIQQRSNGIAIEMVVDRSSSMSAKMNFNRQLLTRLDAVKSVFNEFVKGNGSDLPGRPSDLIGMVAFARYADTIAPLTLAHGALLDFLDRIVLVEQRSEDGTAIGEALALAAARLKKAEETLARQTEKKASAFTIKSKIIILLTDGQSNAGAISPMEAVAMAKDWGIKIYTIGVGGDSSLLPGAPGLLGGLLRQMEDGVNERMLSAIAEKTGGIFRLADDADSLRAVYQEIDSLERSEVESLRYLHYRELFSPLALAALSLLVLEVLAACTVLRRVP